MRNARRSKAVAALALLLAFAAAGAHAREEPLWEAGIGVAALHFPDYRGSSESRNYLLPSPYIVYRGDFFKADRYGLRGVFFSNDRVDLNLSLGASLPVRSGESQAREGMPDLKPSIEIGPSLAVTLWRSLDERVKVAARLPLRGALTLESSPRFIGGQLFPHVNVDIHDPANPERTTYHGFYDMVGMPLPSRSGVNAKRQVVDAWKQPLRIGFGPTYGTRQVGIWSCGPDMTSGTTDDISSWK